jgi:hypothetical protein
VKPSFSISRGWLLVMLLTSGLVSGALGLLAVLAQIAALLGEGAARPAAEVLVPILVGLLGLLKGGVELKAAWRVRLERKQAPGPLHLPPWVRSLALAWLILFWLGLLLLTLNLIYLVVLLMVALIGLMLALVITVATLGFAAKEAFGRYVDALSTVSYPYEVEETIWTTAWDSPAMSVILGIVMVAMLLGPTAYAVYVLVSRPVAEPPA